MTTAYSGLDTFVIRNPEFMIIRITPWFDKPDQYFVHEYVFTLFSEK